MCPALSPESLTCWLKRTLNLKKINKKILVCWYRGRGYFGKSYKGFQQQHSTIIIIIIIKSSTFVTRENSCSNMFFFEKLTNSWIKFSAVVYKSVLSWTQNNVRAMCQGTEKQVMDRQVSDTCKVWSTLIQVAANEDLGEKNFSSLFTFLKHVIRMKFQTKFISEFFVGFVVRRCPMIFSRCRRFAWFVVMHYQLSSRC